MDGNKALGAKIFSLDQSTLWIEALLPGTEGLSATDTISFQASSIDFIRSIGPKASAIHLISGVDIAVQLPYPALLDKLQNTDGPLLDLKSVSYLESRAKLLTRLQEEFKKEAEDAKYAPLENMTFQVWVRPPNKAEFKLFTFSGQDVQMRGVTEGDSIMGGRNMRLTMKDATKAPFDASEFIIEGAFKDMQALCAEVYAQGESKIDLRDFSLRKGTTPPQPEPMRTGPRP